MGNARLNIANYTYLIYIEASCSGISDSMEKNSLVTSYFKLKKELNPTAGHFVEIRNM